MNLFKRIFKSKEKNVTNPIMEKFNAMDIDPLISQLKLSGAVTQFEAEYFSKLGESDAGKAIISGLFSIGFSPIQINEIFYIEKADLDPAKVEPWVDNELHNHSEIYYREGFQNLFLGGSLLATRICINSLGFENRVTLSSLHNVGLAFRDIGDIYYATAFLLYAAKGFEKLKGVWDLETFTATKAFADQAQISGRSDTAHLLLGHLIDVASVIFESGDEIHTSLKDQYNINLIGHQKTGEALKYFKNKYKINKKKFGSNNKLTIESKFYYASSLVGLNDFGKASDLYLELLSETDSSNEELDVDKIHIKLGLSRCMLELSKFENGFNIATEAYDFLKNTKGELNSETIAALFLVGEFQLKLQNYEESLKNLQFVFENRMKIYGLKHPETLRGHSKLSECLKLMGRENEVPVLE